MSVPDRFLRNFFTEINKRLFSEMDENKLFDFIFNSLDLIIPFDRIGIALISGDGKKAEISLKWVRSKIPVNHLKQPYTSHLEGSSLQNIIDTGQARIINNLPEYSQLHPNSESTKLIIQDGIRSSLTCPIKRENRNIGVVFFSSCECNTYQSEHIEIFQEIADELSVVIDQARMRKIAELSSAQSTNFSMILHDLKNPLSIIQGFVEISSNEVWFKKMDAEGKKIFEILLRNTKYMFELLSGLEEFRQLEDTTKILVKNSVNLQEFYKEMVDVGVTISEKKDIKFQAKFPLEAPNLVEFNRLQIRRVLENLFTNAVKYSQRRTQIEFQMIVNGPRLTFEVKDSGLGIPKSEFGKLFREFGKTSVRPTEGEASTGLGLAITKKIVERHGGEIHFVSEVGRGSTFTFWIPI